MWKKAMSLFHINATGVDRIRNREAGNLWTRTGNVIQSPRLRKEETAMQNFFRTFVRLAVLALIAWGIVAGVKYLIGA